MCSETSPELFYPILYSIFEDKPFGSDMCHGRGVCDTDPRPKYNIMKSCLTQNHKSVVTATISVEGFPSQRHTVEGRKPLHIPGERDNKRSDHIRKEFQKVLDGLFQDPRKRSRNICEEVRRTIQKNLAKDSCDNCSSKGSSNPKTPYPSIASIHSPTEHEYPSKDPKASDEEMLQKHELRERNLKPVGPFTEPPNPGKQMKLGKPYQDPSRLKKKFYDDY